MKPNSLRTRGVIFAYLFGPPRFLSREDASAVHGRVCDAHRYDDFSLKYSSPGTRPGSASKGFSIVLERAEGRGGYKVSVNGGGSQEPVRLLIEYIWPPSTPHVSEQLDRTTEAVFEALQGNWQKVLAEVRLRAECDVAGNDAAKYLRDHVIRLNADTVASVDAPIAFASVKLETTPLPPRQNDHFYGPKREMVLEVLRENPKCLYVETMCQWAQIGAAPAGSELRIDLSQVRKIQDSPSQYVEKAYEFLNEQFVRLWDNREGGQA